MILTRCRRLATTTSSVVPLALCRRVGPRVVCAGAVARWASSARGKPQPPPKSRKGSKGAAAGGTVANKARGSDGATTAKAREDDEKEQEAMRAALLALLDDAHPGVSNEEMDAFAVQMDMAVDMMECAREAQDELDELSTVLDDMSAHLLASTDAQVGLKGVSEAEAQKRDAQWVAKTDELLAGVDALKEELDHLAVFIDDCNRHNETVLEEGDGQAMSIEAERVVSLSNRVRDHRARVAAHFAKAPKRDSLEEDDDDDEAIDDDEDDEDGAEEGEEEGAISHFLEEIVRPLPAGWEEETPNPVTEAAKRVHENLQKEQRQQRQRRTLTETLPPATKPGKEKERQQSAASGKKESGKKEKHAPPKADKERSTPAKQPAVNKKDAKAQAVSAPVKGKTAAVKQTPPRNAAAPASSRKKKLD